MENDIRLVDGVTPADGRVEICLNGYWGTLCQEHWGYKEARVVCRQLGYDGCESYIAKHSVSDSLFIQFMSRK